MPDKWVLVKDEPAQKIENLETGLYPNMKRKTTEMFKITSKTTGDFVKLEYNDLKNLIGYYRERNPSKNPVTASMEIEQMNIATCTRQGYHKMICEIKEEY